MNTYSILREIADSWGLLALTLFFIGVVFWAYRPGSRALHDDIAQIPLRHENAPATGCENCEGQCPGRKLAEDL